jgi:hypothetical protein
VYDLLGALTRATLPDGTVIDYLIDPSGRRVGRKVNGVLQQGFLYGSGLGPIAELDGSNGLVSRFVYAGGGNVPNYLVKNGVTYAIITDHLGSVRLVLNTTDGSIAQQMEYDEWGNVLSDSNPGFQPFGFAGGLYDRDLKLVRFGARDYDPETARWTAKDPIRFSSESLNFYAYGMNAPNLLADPEGTETIVSINPAEDFFNAASKIMKTAEFNNLPERVQLRVDYLVHWQYEEIKNASDPLFASHVFADFNAHSDDELDIAAKTFIANHEISGSIDKYQKYRSKKECVEETAVGYVGKPLKLGDSNWNPEGYDDGHSFGWTLKAKDNDQWATPAHDEYNILPLIAEIEKSLPKINDGNKAAEGE